MRSFLIYENEEGEIVAIKKGLSWTGFLFGIYWAIFNRIWYMIIIHLGIVAMLTYFELSNEVLVQRVQIIMSIIYFINGNAMKEQRFIDEGYTFKRRLEAEDSKIAIERYIKFFDHFEGKDFN